MAREEEMITRLVPIRLPMELNTWWYLDYSITKGIWHQWHCGTYAECVEKRKTIRKDVRRQNDEKRTNSRG